MESKVRISSLVRLHKSGNVEYQPTLSPYTVSSYGYIKEEDKLRRLDDYTQTFSRAYLRNLILQWKYAMHEVEDGVASIILSALDNTDSIVNSTMTVLAMFECDPVDESKKFIVAVCSYGCFQTAENLMIIEAFLVCPALQRCKRGSGWFNIFRGFMKQQSPVRTIFLVANQTACGFWKKLGFREYRFDEKPFDPNDPECLILGGFALVMTKGEALYTLTF